MEKISSKLQSCWWQNRRALNLQNSRVTINSSSNSSCGENSIAKMNENPCMIDDNDDRIMQSGDMLMGVI